jgi:hypothetical protein
MICYFHVYFVLINPESIHFIMAPSFFFAQKKPSTDDELNVVSEPSKADTSISLSSKNSSTTSSVASIPQMITPTFARSKKSDKKCIVKTHTRRVKTSRSPLIKSMIKVGTLVARSFKTWPCSRKPGDPPVPVLYRGIVTEINPTTKKIHALFENAQTLRLELNEILPLVVKEKKVELGEKKMSPIQKNVESMNILSLSGHHDSDTVSIHSSDDEVEYIGTKVVPDVQVIKVVGSPDKGGIVIDYTEDNENKNKFTNM